MSTTTTLYNLLKKTTWTIEHEIHEWSLVGLNELLTVEKVVQSFCSEQDLHREHLQIRLPQ